MSRTPIGLEVSTVTPAGGDLIDFFDISDGNKPRKASITAIRQVGVTENAAIAANGDTLTVTAALHAGKVVQFGKLSGTIVTLPAASGTGNIYRFVIGIAATSNANIIKVANSTDVMVGGLAIQADSDSDGTSKIWLAGATADTITFAGVATTGGTKGGYIQIVDYAAGFFAVTVFSQSGGGSEATPFSATV